MKKIFIVFIFLSLVCLWGCKKKKVETKTPEPAKTTEQVKTTEIPPVQTETDEPTPVTTGTVETEPIDEGKSYTVDSECRGKFGYTVDEVLIAIEIKTNTIEFIKEETTSYDILTNDDNEVFFMIDGTKFNFKLDKNKVVISRDGKSQEYKRVFFIEYDFNGGTCESYLTYFFYNEFITLPIPTRGDNEFLGWFEGNNKIEQINENRDYSLKASYESWLPWI